MKHFYRKFDERKSQEFSESEETTEPDEAENSFNEYYKDFPTPNYDDEEYDMIHQKTEEQTCY